MTIVSIAERLGQDEFLARSLHRDYRHVTQAVDAPGSLVSFDVLNELIASHRLEPPRLRLSADGEVLPQHRYAVPVTTRRHTMWQRCACRKSHPPISGGMLILVETRSSFPGSPRQQGVGLGAQEVRPPGARVPGRSLLPGGSPILWRRPP